MVTAIRENEHIQTGCVWLRSDCTIFCKRLNAHAEIHHTNPLERSECKIFRSGKKVAHAKKLVGIVYLVGEKTRVQARSIMSFSFQK